MSAMAKASGMPPSVGSSVAALTGSMITYAATTNTPATRSGIPDERPGATGRTGTPAPMRQSRRGIIHALTTRTTAPTPRSAHGAGEHGEQHGLGGEEVEPSRPALTPDEEQRRRQTQEREEIRGGGHGTRNTAVTERSASANEPARSSGTRKSRSLATTVSRTASAAARTASLPARARSPRRTGTGSARLVTPQGTKRLARSVMETNSRIADAHPTKARYRPEYSSTMASWIIVSSRWVAGLSTGSRPVSASMTMKNATKARRWAGFAASSGSRARRSTMPPRLIVSARSATAKTATMIVRSASAATATSRPQPTPPQAPPQASPASARMKVPSMNRYMRRMMLPANPSAGRATRTGTTRVVTSIVATST